MTLKEEVYYKCLEKVVEKITLLQNTLKDLTESAANETKSTAGDKHETALTMLQIEQENTGRQLKEALLQKSILNKINLQQNPIQVVNGSLIKTNNGFLFISIPLGKIKIGDTNFIALSPQSPLGKKLAGLTVNDSADMNGTKYVIEKIS